MRSQNSFIKKQKAEKKQKRKREKLQKKVEKRDKQTSGELTDMLAYVDADGNPVSPPAEITSEEEADSKEKTSRKPDTRKS